MGTMGKYLFALLAVGALFLWIYTTVGVPAVHVPTVATLVNVPAKSAQSLPASVVAASGSYVDLTGMILLDTTGGTSVPFVQYVTPENKVMTKQLVYAGARGCATYAGDLPCVDTNESGAYPQYPTGTNVRVRGLHVDDRILVYQIDVVTPAAGA
jgi:hypothetical protein